MAFRSVGDAKLERSVAGSTITATTTNKLQQIDTFDLTFRKHEFSYSLLTTNQEQREILSSTASTLNQQQQQHRIQISKGETIPMVDMTNMQLNQPNGSQVQQQAPNQLQQSNNHHLNLHHQSMPQFNSMGHIVESTTTNMPITASTTSSVQVEKMQKEEEQQRRATICDQSTPHLYQQSPQNQQKQQPHQHHQHQQHLFSVLINNKTIKGK